MTQEHNLDIKNANLHLNAEKIKYDIAMEAQIFDAVSKSKAADKNHRLEMKAVKGQLKDGASNLKDEIKKHKLEMEANLKDGASKLKDEITKHKLEMEAQRKIMRHI